MLEIQHQSLPARYPVCQVGFHWPETCRPPLSPFVQDPPIGAMFVISYRIWAKSQADLLDFYERPTRTKPVSDQHCDLGVSWLLFNVSSKTMNIRVLLQEIQIHVLAHSADCLLASNLIHNTGQRFVRTIVLAASVVEQKRQVTVLQAALFTKATAAVLASFKDLAMIAAQLVALLMEGRLAILISLPHNVSPSNAKATLLQQVPCFPECCMTLRMNFSIASPPDVSACQALILPSVVLIDFDLLTYEWSSLLRRDPIVDFSFADCHATVCSNGLQGQWD